MSSKSPEVRTPKGNLVRLNAARAKLALTMLSDGKCFKDIVEAIATKWNVCRSTAAIDIRAAKRLLAAEIGDMVDERAAEAKRMERVAEKAEREGKWLAAVAASRERSRLLGLHAPKKIEIEHSGSVEIALEIDATLAILDDEDHAALRRITEKLEGARVAGLLPAVSGPDGNDDALDAEIVESESSDEEPN
jgi:hypothetical protein